MNKAANSNKSALGHIEAILKLTVNKYHIINH